MKCSDSLDHFIFIQEHMALDKWCAYLIKKRIWLTLADWAQEICLIALCAATLNEDSSEKNN